MNENQAFEPARSFWEDPALGLDSITTVERLRQRRGRRRRRRHPLGRDRPAGGGEVKRAVTHPAARSQPSRCSAPAAAGGGAAERPHSGQRGRRVRPGVVRRVRHAGTRTRRADSGDSGAGSAGVAAPDRPDGSGAPFGEEERDGDDVEFVTTSSTTTTTTTTTTTLPPTTTSTTTTSTTTPRRRRRQRRRRPRRRPRTSTHRRPCRRRRRCGARSPPMRCSSPARPCSPTQAIADLGAVVAEHRRDVRVGAREGHTDHRGTDAEQPRPEPGAGRRGRGALVDGRHRRRRSSPPSGSARPSAHQRRTTPTDDEMAADRRVDVVVDAEVPITPIVLIGPSIDARTPLRSIGRPAQRPGRMGRCPSGQREQTVNLPALPTEVQILPGPPRERISETVLMPRTGQKCPIRGMRIESAVRSRTQPRRGAGRARPAA